MGAERVSGEDFKCQGGSETLETAVACRAATWAALPRVARIVPAAERWNFALELESGEWVDFELGRMKWAALHPGSGGSGPVVTACWAPGDDMAYAVPAELLSELLPYFPGVEDMLREGVQSFLNRAA